MRALARGVLAWLVLAAVLALGAAALLAAPIVLLAALVLAGRRARRAAHDGRGAGGPVYEAEFRVLDEAPVERS